jgi:predicted GNAT superfamily acetyltransferase
MIDEINAGDDSDRLFVYWDLTQKSETSEVSPNAVSIEVPEDIEALRKSDLNAAKEWRSKTRQKLEPLMADGWTVKRMQDRTHLLVEPPK